MKTEVPCAMTPARKCSATKINGRPCRAWAVKDSLPPLCNRHRELPPAGKTIIVAGAASGPAFEVQTKEASFNPSGKTPEESSEGAHARAALEFYGRSFTIDEAAALVNLALAGSLNGEVAATRVAIRRALQQLKEELPPTEYTQLAGIIFTGANTIARLLRARRSLSGEAAEGIIGALATGLDELSVEWRVDI